MRAEPLADSPLETSGDEYLVSPAEIFAVLWRRIWVILLVALVCASAAVAYSMTRTPLYEAEITVLVGQESGVVDPNNLSGNVQGLQGLTQTMAEAVNSRPIAQGVIDELGLSMQPGELLESLAVEQVTDTQFIQIAYTDPSPERAQRVANTVGETFSERISEVSPEASSITATVWEQAVVPEQPVSPDPLQNGLLALILGIMLGVGLAFLLEYLDNTWRSPEEAERVSGVPTFGLVPKFDPPKAKKKSVRHTEAYADEPQGLADHLLSTNKKVAGNSGNPGEEPLEGLAGHLATVLEPNGAASESYRTLRTNLLYSIVDLPLQVVTVTSAGPGEGKSTTCNNLAVTLAQAGKQVIILDCDLRRPTLHTAFGLRNLHGLVNVLAGERELPKVWQEPLKGMKVVTAGPVPPNPAELLGSGRFTELLEQAREDFDYVLLDTPPIQAVSDPLILASQSDGTLLVLDAQETRKGSVRRSTQSLEGVGAHVLGTVMNNVKADKNGYYYGYRYEYGPR